MPDTSSSPQIHVWINQQPLAMPLGATLADAVQKAQTAGSLQAPFAAAVNLQFVPRAHYAHHILQDQDRIELISPITGG